MPARRTSAALAVMTLLVTPAAAQGRSSPLQVVLDYEVEPSVRGCPSAEELQANISRQLGYDPFVVSPGAQRQRVRVAIAPQSAGPEASIEWLDQAGSPEGERRLGSVDEDCAELAAGVAFAVAVQLQLRAQVAAPPATPPPPPPKPAPPAVLPPATTPQLSVLAGAGGLGRYGRQPGVAAGWRAFTALRARPWSLQLDGHATLPTTSRDAEDRGFSAKELGIDVAPCFRHGALDACTLASFSRLSIRGEGVDRPQSPASWGFGVGARLQLVLPWRDRVAAVIHADVLAHLTPRDILLNRERFWSTAPLGVAIGLDVAAIFR